MGAFQACPTRQAALRDRSAGRERCRRAAHHLVPASAHSKCAGTVRGRVHQRQRARREAPEGADLTSVKERLTAARPQQRSPRVECDYTRNGGKNGYFTCENLLFLRKNKMRPVLVMTTSDLESPTRRKRSRGACSKILCQWPDVQGGCPALSVVFTTALEHGGARRHLAAPLPCRRQIVERLLPVCLQSQPTSPTLGDELDGCFLERETMRS